MAALTPTAAEVQAGTGATAKFLTATFGEAVTAGQPVYIKAADDKFWLAQSDGTAAEADVVGIAVCGGAAEQKGFAQSAGTLTFGATAAIAAGDQIWLHTDAGSLTATEADITSGDFATFIGTANASDQIVMDIGVSGVAHA